MEQHGLLDMGTHRASLDAFAGLEKQGRGGARGMAAWRRPSRRAPMRRRRLPPRARTRISCHSVKELEALSPKPDDEEKLAEERQLLRAGSALGEAVTQAMGELEHEAGRGRALSNRAPPGRAQCRQGDGTARHGAAAARAGR